jgi:hypothetical protein
MNQNYNEEFIDDLYRMWGKLGWMNSVGVYCGDVDVEKLIAETTHAARYEGRLSTALMTWVKDYGDLINKNRLISFLDQADTAILGATLDIAMKYGGTEDFTPITKLCRPIEPAEVIVKGLDDIDIYIEWQKKYPKEEFLKWGLFCATIDFYEDCFRTREWVLENNKNLNLKSAVEQ